MKIETLHTFSSAISVFMETEIFKQSFGLRNFEEDKKDIENIFYGENQKIIGLNSVLHSNHIEIFSASKKYEEIKNDINIFPSGRDGIIIKDLKPESEKFALLLCVADCSAISFADKKGDFMGVVHAGHKGVATGMIQNLCDFFDKNTEEKNDVEIFIAPMLGKYFEFGRKLYEQNFSHILDSQGLSFEEYFCGVDDTKGFLDLRGMIEDIFIKRGFQSQKIIFDKRETNNPQNNLPSYRLYTLHHHLQEKLKNNEKLNLLEKELQSSPFCDNYVEQRRILVGVRN
ncbi:hypothetical protein HGA92_02300 [Candidatus Gracilibacteria bacterium]|nr:hypothetical protein [Candidatus Gracilibacteria bacterium]NUJ99394.1 hypothetical protein [Candidatus Gracilibacteria bacterium]